jgi:ribonuclease J
LLDLWPRLRVPVYATAFTAHLLSAKAASEPGSEPVPITIVRAGDRITIGPFDVEYIEVAHSIPESHALAIRTPLGLVVHSGDWKIDPAPTIGRNTDAARMHQLGEEGVLALLCDSTNALREGHSRSEADVARALTLLIAEAPRRVGFTLFASNVGRILSIARAAGGCRPRRGGLRARHAAGDRCRAGVRHARRRAAVSWTRKPTGYIPPDKLVVLLSGSQGEAARRTVARSPMRSIRGSTCSAATRWCSPRGPSLATNSPSMQS